MCIISQSLRMTVSETIKLYVFGDVLSTQIDFIKKNFFRFEPVTLPRPLVVSVNVDGETRTVHVVNNLAIEQGESGIIVNIARDSQSEWKWENARRLPMAVRICVGGLRPEIPVDYPNTSWVETVEFGWLENLVHQHLVVTSRSENEAAIYKNQAEKFNGFIESVGAYMKRAKVPRPSDLTDLAVLPISMKQDATIHIACIHRLNPLFRRQWKTAFGLDSAYHKENRHFIVLDRNDAYMFVYFTE